jgi:Flp pilus assembly protein TadG
VGARRNPLAVRPGRAGVATVEFAMVLPLLMILLLGIWEVGRLVQVSQVLQNAAREAARQASTGTATLAEIKSATGAYITGAEPRVTNLAGFDVLFNDLSRPAVTDPTAAVQLDHFTITVNVPFDNIRWSATKMFVPSGMKVSATVDWYSMRDLPVTVSPGIPVE